LAVTKPARCPLIGVTGPDRAGLGAWLMTALAVRRAGGRASRITPSTHPIPRLDGLIIGGGADVDPALYGQATESILSSPGETGQPLRKQLLSIAMLPLMFALRRLLSAKAAIVDTRRDRLETALIRHAVSLRLPLLGICRGAQLLNVFFGGSLHRDLSSFYAETPQVRSIRPHKLIRVAADSRLSDVLGAGPCWVNALNKQAINVVGDGLRVAACEEGGVIQAVEHCRLPFVVGVQWHPEYLPHLRTQQGLFRRLVAAAAQSRREADASAGYSQ